jgi:transcriptional regulator with XRE-family HTH domain
MGVDRHHLRQAVDAARMLGNQLAVARRRQRRTAAEVAERVGVTRVTLRRIERGDPSTAIGLYFDTAAVLGVPLFGVEGPELAELVARGERELALLPARIRGADLDVDDDF